MKVLAGVYSVAFLLTPGAAFGGSIAGTVELGHAMQAEKTVVYVEHVPEGAFEKDPAAARLSQRGAQFRPRVLPVMRGTEVDMTNDDWVSHSVFSRAATKPFDLGIYGQDVKKAVSFEKSGVVEVFCAIHPRMNGVILVLQNPFFAKPNPDGSFAIDGVPPGTYRLKVYRPGVTLSATQVTVPASGSVRVSF